MKNTFKTLALMISMAGTLCAFGVPKNDTTIVEFSEKGVKKWVQVSTKGNKSASFKIPSVLSVESLLEEIGVDSNDRKRAIVILSESSKGKKDTIISISREGKRIIITSSDKLKFSQDSTIRSKQTETQREETRSKNEDKNRDESVVERIIREEVIEKVIPPAKPKKFFSNNDFGIYLGLNNYGNDDNFTWQGSTGRLNTTNSRYVALSWRRNATLIRGNAVDFAFSYGPEIAWNNFMLNGNQKFVESTNGEPNIVAVSERLKKSKLVVPMVNLPVMFNFGFKEAKFRFGLGGYVGYRIGGYSKQRLDNGARQHDKGNFGLNDFRGGLTAEFGRKNSTAFFVRYDLSDLFANQPKTTMPDVRAWSFGVRL